MSSLELALADIEMMRAAYPDETSTIDSIPEAFPIVVTLQLNKSDFIELEFGHGYPTRSNIQVLRYRSSKQNERLERAVAAVRRTAQECLENGVEGGLACCAAALEAWNECQDESDPVKEETVACPPTITKSFNWISGEPLVDRKSTFLGHVKSKAPTRKNPESQALSGRPNCKNFGRW